MSRRGLVISALVATAALAVALALALRSSSGPGALWPVGGTTHAYKVSVSVPRGFYVYPEYGCFYAEHGNVYAVNGCEGRTVVVIGRFLTNFPVPRSWPGWRGDGRGSGPPSDGVALDVLVDSAPPPPGEAGLLRLPLSAKQPWPWGIETLPGPWSSLRGAAAYRAAARNGDFRFGNALYQVTYWIGPDASPSDRAAVLRALRSIRPTR